MPTISTELPVTLKSLWSISKLARR